MYIYLMPSIDFEIVDTWGISASTEWRSQMLPSMSFWGISFYSLTSSLEYSAKSVLYHEWFLVRGIRWKGLLFKSLLLLATIANQLQHLSSKCQILSSFSVSISLLPSSPSHYYRPHLNKCDSLLMDSHGSRPFLLQPI